MLSTISWVSISETKFGIIVASNAYGAPYAKNAHFHSGGSVRFLLVGKSPKPFESQVPCELRTLRALSLYGIRFHFAAILFWG